MMVGCGYTAAVKFPSGWDVPSSLMLTNSNGMCARCKALNAYVVLPEAEAVIQASIRVCNLCKKIETEVAISSALFADPAEQELHDVLIRLNKELIPDIVTYNYAGALKLAEQVVEPVNKFFDSVMVMDENVDIKNNRLALLEQAKEVTNAVGDLSCIVL